MVISLVNNVLWQNNTLNILKVFGSWSHQQSITLKRFRDIIDIWLAEVFLYCKKPRININVLISSPCMCDHVTILHTVFISSLYFQNKDQTLWQWNITHQSLSSNFYLLIRLSDASSCPVYAILFLIFVYSTNSRPSKLNIFDSNSRRIWF